MFYHPTTSECTKFKIQLQQVGFECPLYFLSVPLKLHSLNDKVPFVGSHHLPKFWGQNQNVTTRVTLQEPAINTNGIKADLYFQTLNYS